MGFRLFQNIRGRIFLIISVVLVLVAGGFIYFNHGSFSFKADTNFPSDGSNWQILTNSLEDNKLTSRTLHVRVNTPTTGAVAYRLTKVGDSTSDLTKANTAGWLEGDDGYVALEVTNGATMRTLVLTAYSVKDASDDSNILYKYPEQKTIYYDYSFEKVTYNLTAEVLPIGDFKIKATPASFPELANQAKYYKWTFYKPIFNSLGVLTSWGLLSTSTTGEAILPVATSAPGTMYVAVSATSGSNHDSAGYYDGLSTVLSTTIDTATHINKIVVKVKPEHGDGPAITPGFSTVTVTSDNTIPSDFKIPLIKSQITMFSGGLLDIPLHGANPYQIQLDLPMGVILKPYADPTYPTCFTEATTGAGLASGYHRYTLDKDKATIAAAYKLNPKVVDYDSWGFANSFTRLYLTFSSDLVGRPDLSDLSMKIRAYNAGHQDDANLWQTQGLTLEAPPADLKLPTRLTTSFTWTSSTKKQSFLLDGTNGNINGFLSLYRSLGFNTVPNNLTTTNPTGDAAVGMFTPEERTASAWQGLKYGPEISPFALDYQGDSIFYGITYDHFTIPKVGTKPTIQEFQTFADAFDLGDFNARFHLSLTDDEYAIEKPKWMNAVEYSITSGSLDVAYDGILLSKNLKTYGQILAKTKPEYLYIDTEEFPSFTSWKTRISSSVNAQVRKEGGETDLHEATRIVDKFWENFANTVSQNSPNTKVVFWGSEAANNAGYQVTSWDIMEKYHFIQQSDAYIPSRNLEEYNKLVRANRLALPNGYGEMPNISTGTYNEIDPEMIFDQVIHTFLNGATGISVFGESAIDDMADVLNISKAIKLISPFEDLIMDGEVAYSDISNSSNAVVSAMKQNGNYLIGVTPQDKTQPVGFSIHTGESKSYELVDLKTNESTIITGQDIQISDKILSVTTVYSLRPASAELKLSADKKYVVSGSEVTYSVSYKNTTGSAINTISFNIPVPSFAQIVAGSITVGGVSTDNKINWSLPTLLPDQEFKAEYKVNIK